MARAYERTFKVQKDNYSYKGIIAYLKIPSDADVSDGNATDYLNWYIGFNDANGHKVEAGINFTKKYNKTTKQFGKFINANGANLTDSLPLTNQPSPGDLIKLKLVNNGNNSVSFFINDSLFYSGSCTIGNLVQVKLVHGTEGNACEYTDAEFRSAQYRNSSGTWTSWTSSYTPYWATGSEVLDIDVVSEFNYMITNAS